MTTHHVPARLLLAPLLALPLLALPSAAAEGSTLTTRRPAASWTGTTAAGPDCARPVDTCHVHVLDVTARAGQLVTVALGDGSPLEVLAPDGRLVARDNVTDLNGPAEDEDGDDTTSDVTFEHERAGTVRYRVRVSVLDPLPSSGLSYRATARLGGTALDRDPVCALTEPPVLDLDAGEVLPLHVRVVTSPDLLADMKRGVPVAVDAYRAIGVRLTVSYDVTRLPSGDSFALRAFAKARYGGRRPAGVDAVYVANQQFGGGQADCIGGVLHPELGFSVGQVRYSPENVLGEKGTGTVSAGIILAHEVGHTVGGHHEAGNCVEGVPAQAGAGTSTESRGPCTVMSPAGLTIGRSFSTLERGAIRATLLRRR